VGLLRARDWAFERAASIGFHEAQGTVIQTFDDDPSLVHLAVMEAA